jgi:hypothetical protein
MQGPDDVPIPGGTVYVRQRACKYPGGAASTTEHHQHVRRFMIPKDAYRVAVRSLSAVDARLDNRVSNHSAHASSVGKGPQRPYSSVPRMTSTSQTNVTSPGNGQLASRTRIQSAPTRRNNAWSWFSFYNTYFFMTVAFGIFIGHLSMYFICDSCI